MLRVKVFGLKLINSCFICITLDASQAKMSVDLFLLLGVYLWRELSIDHLPVSSKSN